MLATAHAAPAATLGLKMSQAGKAGASVHEGAIPSIKVTVKTPVVEGAVEVSDRGVSASATAPPAPAAANPLASPSKPRAGAVSERRPSDAPRPHRRGTPGADRFVIERVAQAAEPAGTSGREPRSAPAPRPSAPEPATVSADGSRALANAASSGGTTAALAALFFLAVVFASWIAPLVGTTLRPAALSFALQRPG